MFLASVGRDALVPPPTLRKGTSPLSFRGNEVTVGISRKGTRTQRNSISQTPDRGRTICGGPRANRPTAGNKAKRYFAAVISSVSREIPCSRNDNNRTRIPKLLVRTGSSLRRRRNPKFLKNASFLRFGGRQGSKKVEKNIKKPLKIS